MASISELVALFTKGETGKLLARTFDGKRGRVYCNEDSDFIITFESKEKTPTGSQIAKVVTEYYSRLGYTVRPSEGRGENCFEALIFPGTSKDGQVSLVITTRYPFPAPGQGNASLRMSSHFI